MPAVRSLLTASQVRRRGGLSLQARFQQATHQRQMVKNDPCRASYYQTKTKVWPIAATDIEKKRDEE